MSISFEELTRRLEATKAISAVLEKLPPTTLIMTPQLVRAAVTDHPILMDPIALSALDVLGAKENGFLFRSFREQLEKIQAGN